VEAPDKQRGRVVKFNDEYPTCDETYVTLCIYSDTLKPDMISGALGLKPTSSHQTGDLISEERTETFKVHAWFLSTEGKVESKDSRRHLEMIISQLADKKSALETLTHDCTMNISCYWSSASGHGGPTMAIEQMAFLSEVGLELSFDFYDTSSSAE